MNVAKAVEEKPLPKIFLFHREFEQHPFFSTIFKPFADYFDRSASIRITCPEENPYEPGRWTGSANVTPGAVRLEIRWQSPKRRSTVTSLHYAMKHYWCSFQESKELVSSVTNYDSEDEVDSEGVDVCRCVMENDAVAVSLKSDAWVPVELLQKLRDGMKSKENVVTDPF